MKRIPRKPSIKKTGVPVNIWITKELYESIRQAVIASGLSMSEIARNAFSTETKRIIDGKKGS